jgi:hypothetical protein
LALRLIKAVGCIILVTLACLAGFGTGCSAQGEGERCTFFTASGLDAGDFNGTQECQSGLVCKQAFNTALYPYDRCCPLDLTNSANVPACYEPNLMADAGTGEAGPTDGPTESSPTDSPTKDAPTKDSPTKDSPGKDAPPADVQKSDAPPPDAKPDSSTD